MFNELMSVVSLALIAAFLLYPYNSLRLDKMRQRMFALRDELFDDAASGRIDFESKAYGATRILLNGAIRFAHQISFSRLIAHRIIFRDAGMPDEFENAMNSSSEKDRKLCRSYIERADLIVFDYVFSSPFVLIIVVPQLCALILQKIGIDVGLWFLGVCKAQFAEFNRRAFEEGRA